MSIPWGWLGSWFFNLEATSSLSSAGNGTGQPVIWTNTPDETGKAAPGSTAASEIVSFELTTAQLTFTAAGTVTMGFTNPSDPTDFQVATAPFSVSATANAFAYTGGTPPDWSAKEPSDYFPEGFEQPGYIAGSNGVTVPFTLLWGTQTATCSAAIIAENIYAILGSDDANGYPTQYTKDLECSLLFQGDSTSHLILAASTNINSTTVDGGDSSPLTNDLGPISLLHVPSSDPAAAHLFWNTQDVTPSMTLASCSLTVTAQFTQPAAIA